MNNFVGGHAREICHLYIYIFVSLQTTNQDCSHILILYVVVQFYRNIECFESISEPKI